STVTTRAPSARKRSTVARPIPAAPPVTSATRPASAPRSVVEAVIRPSEQLGASRPHDRGVLVADSTPEIGPVDAGLGDDDHALAELVGAPRHELGARLVQAEADAVPGVMRELLEAGVGARRSRGRVDVAPGRAGDGGRERGRGGRADGL